MPSTRGTPSIDETQEVARILFQHFYRERFTTERDVQYEDLILPPNESISSFVCRTFDGYSNSLLASIGRDLRRIAEEVEKSCERETIRRRASEIDIFGTTHEEFRRLLNELFFNGISRERIVVLFFFCTDVALRAYDSYPLEYCFRFLSWSLSFILDTICDWVQRHGGWVSCSAFTFSLTQPSFLTQGVVLGTYIANLGYFALMVVVGISCVIYIKKNLWPSES
ncbi:apoptosis regulator BAX-like protein [Dinothrombium tinctorium]|uniref:Apoptosis regulator BAX-like protein n=1 Tax=Dinothrombium tinctorium TaxID=1965070 RepID=A0A3S3P8Y4_9ACAR|nr:apoptosis regulator BAX-like protein [Dinothrombium tinctorium]RWS17528.1 apoptosis regulator BAX-like protein [Dinothrombium tinctorium]